MLSIGIVGGTGYTGVELHDPAKTDPAHARQLAKKHALPILTIMEDLRLTGDISHYLVGREFAWPVSDENHALMHRVLDQCWGLHGRVATREQVRVPLAEGVADIGEHRAQRTRAVLAEYDEGKDHLTLTLGTTRAQRGALQLKGFLLLPVRLVAVRLVVRVGRADNSRSVGQVRSDVANVNDNLAGGLPTTADAQSTA